MRFKTMQTSASATAKCVLVALLAAPFALVACGGKRSVNRSDGSVGGAGSGSTGGAAGEPDGTGANAAAGEESGGTAGSGGAGASGGHAGSGTAGDAAAASGKSGDTGTGGVTAGAAGFSGSGGQDQAGAGNGGSPSAGTSGSAGQGEGGMAMRDPEWAMWPMPHAADSGFPNPSSYTDLGDGTLRDEVTGLVWQKSNSGRDWQAFKDNCEGLGGSWRLPSMIELVSLVGGPLERNSPYAPLRGLAGSLWSSSPVLEDPTRAWTVLMPDGSSYYFPKDSGLNALCVSEGATRASPHYETGMVEGIPAVRDNWTGLVWEQPISTATYTFAEAEGVCAERGAGWRAPSVKELQTLIDRRRSMPSIDPTFFPGTPSDYFWSATPYAVESIRWLVTFGPGIANTFSEREVYVRCVHADPEAASAPN
jgi:hypothetical protein